MTEEQKQKQSAHADKIAIETRIMRTPDGYGKSRAMIREQAQRELIKFQAEQIPDRKEEPPKPFKMEIQAGEFTPRPMNIGDQGDTGGPKNGGGGGGGGSQTPMLKNENGTYVVYRMLYATRSQP